MSSKSRGMRAQICPLSKRSDIFISAQLKTSQECHKLCPTPLNTWYTPSQNKLSPPQTQRPTIKPEWHCSKRVQNPAPPFKLGLARVSRHRNPHRDAASRKKTPNVQSLAVLKLLRKINWYSIRIYRNQINYLKSQMWDPSFGAPQQRRPKKHTTASWTKWAPN